MLARLSLALALVASLAAPALAIPNASLAASIKLARTQKKDLMGVVYYVDKAGKVAGESWNSEMAGWTDAGADKLRAVVMGKRKLKHKLTSGKSHVVFTYMDGTTVRYNRRREKILTMDIASPGFSIKTLGAQKYTQVMDWKEAPYQKKAW